MSETAARLVGPFPEGEDPETYDRRRRRVFWHMPSGLYLLGSAAGGRRNLMTCNWATQVAAEPKLLAAAVERDAASAGLVREGAGFTLALVAREDRAMVRKFVRPAEDDRDARTLNGVAYLDAPVTGAPVPAAAVAFLDCRLAHELALGSHVLFVGEVVYAAFGDGTEDAEVLRMEDTRMNYGG